MYVDQLKLQMVSTYPQTLVVFLLHWDS